MEDVDAPPLLSMKQAPGARVELPPFETAGPLLRLDEPELPVADADESEVPSAEAMVAQLKDLRAKLDDGIAFCANMATEKDNATRAVADARRELEQLRAAPPAGRDKAAAVAERGRRVPAVSDRARAATRLPPAAGSRRPSRPRTSKLAASASSSSSSQPSSPSSSATRATRYPRSSGTSSTRTRATTARRRPKGLAFCVSRCFFPSGWGASAWLRAAPMLNVN